MLSGAGGAAGGAAGINERAAAVRVTLLKVPFKVFRIEHWTALWGYGGPAAGPQACYTACGNLWGGGPFYSPRFARPRAPHPSLRRTTRSLRSVRGKSE